MGKKKYRKLKERLARLEQNQKKDSEIISDLLDYLMRVDENFINNPDTFDSWYTKLSKMRNDDADRKECARARRVLEEQGYIVAVDEQSLDAARLKKWVQNPTIINETGILPRLPDDDDIPF